MTLLRQIIAEAERRFRARRADEAARIRETWAPGWPEEAGIPDFHFGLMPDALRPNRLPPTKLPRDDVADVDVLRKHANAGYVILGVDETGWPVYGRKEKDPKA